MHHKHFVRTLESALALQQAGKVEEARKLYAQARGAAPRVFDCWHLSGALAFQTGRLDEAIQFLTRARQLEPQNAACKLFLGMALADAGRFAEAEKPLRTAVEKFPHNQEAWLNLARTLRALGRPESDAAECERQAGIGPVTSVAVAV